MICTGRSQPGVFESGAQIGVSPQQGVRRFAKRIFVDSAFQRNPDLMA